MKSLFSIFKRDENTNHIGEWNLVNYSINGEKDESISIVIEFTDNNGVEIQFTDKDVIGAYNFGNYKINYNDNTSVKFK
ncbi:MAG: hypothetical protein GY828_01545 [Candidatus Gracilibacteria bacterium]|nr:hypothetical protein [Candidatus Gracilibacteria bacterium]